MQGTPLTRSVETVSTDNELQVRNGQDHQRVYDPLAVNLLTDILTELKKLNTQLSFITDAEL